MKATSINPDFPQITFFFFFLELIYSQTFHLHLAHPPHQHLQREHDEPGPTHISPGRPFSSKQQVVIITTSSLSSASLILEASTVITFLLQGIFTSSLTLRGAGAPLCLGSPYCLFCCNSSSNLPPAPSAL